MTTTTTSTTTATPVTGQCTITLALAVSKKATSRVKSFYTDNGGQNQKNAIPRTLTVSIFGMVEHVCVLLSLVVVGS